MYGALLCARRWDAIVPGAVIVLTEFTNRQVIVQLRYTKLLSVK